MGSTRCGPGYLWREREHGHRHTYNTCFASSIGICPVYISLLPFWQPRRAPARRLDKAYCLRTASGLTQTRQRPRDSKRISRPFPASFLAITSMSGSSRIPSSSPACTSRSLAPSAHIMIMAKKYMEMARRARNCLHGFGIHSATIQPEVCCDQNQTH